MTDEVLASQADYYRRRAGEYDVTAYGDVVAARARIARLVAEMDPSGTVLEIACGTGLWTEALAGLAESVTAIDVAPEAVAIARDRVRSNNVRFEVADVFSWATAARFDVIFFSAWLSHVPVSRFEQFWRLLRGLLAAGGRVLFVDEHVEGRDKETYLPGGDEIVERQLRDGSRYRIVKNFVDPERLVRRLRGDAVRCMCPWPRGCRDPSHGQPRKGVRRRHCTARTRRQRRRRALQSSTSGLLNRCSDNEP